MTKHAILLAWAACAALAANAQPITNGVALAYIAPENQVFYRMRYPEGGYREFQRNLTNFRSMAGAGGWIAKFGGGGKIAVLGMGPEGVERYVFERGRLVSCVIRGETNNFAYADARIPPDGAEPPYHFGSVQEAAWHSKSYAKAPKDAGQLLKGKWKKSGRLAWPFVNPNENGFLYASLALASLWLLAFRRRELKIAGVALSLAFFVPLVLTESRGAMLALAVGLVPTVAANFRTLVRSRWTYVVAAVAACFFAVWVSTQGTRFFTRGFKGRSSWSNETRLDMWRMASPMMADAPDGWQMNAGKAYLDWYEEFDCFTAPGSLINDHLSRMVRMSRPGRGTYVFCWAAILAGLALAAVKTGRGVPAGMVAASAVAAWFNPLMSNRLLWLVPIAAVAPELAMELKRLCWRRWAVGAGIGAAAALAALGTVSWLAASTPRPYGISIRADGPRVCVGGVNPQVWIVDDGLSLGGAFACKELRAGLAAARNAGAAGSVGYVRSCADLPAKRIARLVLGGNAGDEWLSAVSGSAELQSRLPGEVVFISPPFPPSAIPPALFEAAKVRYVTGEFNARYSREFDAPPPFVEIVEGMELYLNGWTRYALGG